MRAGLLFVMLCLAVGGLSVADAQDESIKGEELPLPRLFIEKGDEELLKVAPKDGVIAGPKAWAKLWKVWGGEKEPPKVDFAKELVLVAAYPGPNIIKVKELKLDDKGDLKFKWFSTIRVGPGFTAKFLKVSREGVKTVNGKELPKE